MFKWVGGPAYTAIEYLNKEPDATLALQTAKAVFNQFWGLQQRTTTNVLKKLFDGPEIKPKDADSLRDLISKLRDAYYSGASAGDVSHLDNIENIRKIVSKKVPFISREFCNSTFTLEHVHMQKITFNHLIDYLTMVSQKQASAFGITVCPK